MSKPKNTQSGRINVRPLPNPDDGFRIQYRTEADLRASLAELASLYGWWVEEEVVVPGWGRIDLVLRADTDLPPYLVELKLELARPADVRRAFQQADGYSRWWAKEHGEANSPLLVAKAPDMSVIDPVADAYPTVTFCTIGVFINALRTWQPRRERFRAASVNVEILREQLAKYEIALGHVATETRRADEAAAYAEHMAWIAAGQPSSTSVVDF